MVQILWVRPLDGTFYTFILLVQLAEGSEGPRVLNKRQARGKLRMIQMVEGHQTYNSPGALASGLISSL